MARFINIGIYLIWRIISKGTFVWEYSGIRMYSGTYSGYSAPGSRIARMESRYSGMRIAPKQTLPCIIPIILIPDWSQTNAPLFSLFIDRNPITWPANNCLQIMVCSGVNVFAVSNIRLRRNFNHVINWFGQIASLNPYGHQRLVWFLHAVFYG